MRRIGIAALVLMSSISVTAVIQRISEEPAAAEACAIFEGGYRTTRDPCPPTAPMPVCTTFAGAGSCSRWLLFVGTGATQDIHECDIDEYQHSFLSLVPTTPPDSGPFCYGQPPAGAAPGDITPVWTKLPVEAKSAVVNLTMVDGATWGYITADRCSTMVAGPQTTSNGNHDQYVAIANLAIAPLDTDGRFCLYNSRRVNLAADVQGYFAPPAPGGLLFVPATPRRLIDTRVAPATTPASGAITRVQTGVPAGTPAVLVNIAMVDGAQPGYITADRCSALTSGPQTRSTGNFVKSTAVANLAMVALDPDGAFCIYNSVVTNLVVDLQGSFVASSPNGVGFDLTPPKRLFDSRTLPITGVRAGWITRVETGLPSGSSAALVNLTVTDAVMPGYITADKCSALTSGPHAQSNSNYAYGTPISNMAVVALDADGAFCIYNSVAINLVVDLQGVFAANGSHRFYPVPPSRALDTRR